jgi:hypothetical protein
MSHSEDVHLFQLGRQWRKEVHQGISQLPAPGIGRYHLAGYPSSVLVSYLTPTFQIIAPIQEKKHENKD